MACYECNTNQDCDNCETLGTACFSRGDTFSDGTPFRTCGDPDCGGFTPDYPHPFLPKSPGINNLLAALFVELSAPDIVDQTNSNITYVDPTTNVTYNVWPNTTEARAYYGKYIKPQFENRTEVWFKSLSYFGGTNLNKPSSSSASGCSSCNRFNANSPERREEAALNNAVNPFAHTYKHGEQFAMAVAKEFKMIQALKLAHPELARKLIDDSADPRTRALFSDANINEIVGAFALDTTPPTQTHQQLLERANFLAKQPKLIYPNYYKVQKHATGLKHALLSQVPPHLAEYSTSMSAHEPNFRKRMQNLEDVWRHSTH
jgi:hypothetical protein